jgi:hypothetical protein
LVVWAISEGRECARKVDEVLMGGEFVGREGCLLKIKRFYCQELFEID